MILGVAQVVLNAESLPDAEAELVAAGYEPSFRESDLPCHPQKLPFLTRPRSRLAMVHLTPPVPGPAIELTSYGDGPPAGAPAWRLELPAVSLFARRPKESLRFWSEGLGFVETSPGRLEPRTPLPAWRVPIELRTADGGSFEPSTVDAAGCVLVTVLATDVAEAVARIAALSARRTEVWEETVNRRQVRVAFVEGPSGELVELLEVPVGSSSRAIATTEVTACRAS